MMNSISKTQQLVTYLEKAYSENDKRVRDHCHVTGEYRGSAHEACNLNFKLTDKIPVIFQNLRGYDSHFITQ